MNLSPEQLESIYKILQNLFETAKAKFLGRFYTGPAIFFEIAKQQTPLDTIGGIFEYALRATMDDPQIDENLIRSLAQISGNYIEAEKNRAMQRIIDSVQELDDPNKIPIVVEKAVNKSNSYIDLLINTETRNVQARAEVSGIQQLGASIGVDDPTVVRLGVWDNKICDACLALWHMPDNIKIPRAWKLSELKEGYNKDPQNPIPTISPTHPRCRHILTIVPPNYGYDANGYPKYIRFGYDMYEEQRGIKKNERDYTELGATFDIYDFLTKHENCNCDHQPITRTENSHK